MLQLSVNINLKPHAKFHETPAKDLQEKLLEIWPLQRVCSPVLLWFSSFHIPVYMYSNIPNVLSVNFKVNYYQRKMAMKGMFGLPRFPVIFYLQSLRERILDEHSDHIKQQKVYEFSPKKVSFSWRTAKLDSFVLSEWEKQQTDWKYVI